MKPAYPLSFARRIRTLSPAILALVVVSAGSLAAPRDPSAPSTKVIVRDLNLSTEAGVATLYIRIKGAARRVCDQSVSTTDPKGKYLWWRCYSATVTDAVARVNNARLTAMHAEKTGHKISG